MRSRYYTLVLAAMVGILTVSLLIFVIAPGALASNSHGSSYLQQEAPHTRTAASLHTVVITPTKDNTLYETDDGSLSNGAGSYFFAGRTNNGEIRRAVIAFDVAGNIPAGSRVVSATLTLNMSKTIAGAQTVSLHRLSVDWGEGTSDAGFEEGGGATATSGDATWLHTFYDTDVWSTPGGDFTATVSAATTVNAIGSYTWGPASRMTTDIQGWLDAPATNFGWLIKGNESTLPTAKRFDSGDNPDPNVHPTLTIVYIEDPLTNYLPVILN